MWCSVTSSCCVQFVVFIFFIFLSAISGSTPRDIDFGDAIDSARDWRDENPCNSTEYCMETFTPGIEYALDANYSVAHKPVCVAGLCTCGRWCLSRSRKFDGEDFYYCGPCGRVGSSCVASQCDSSIAICKDDGYCHCYNKGKFYDAYFCYIPYYGYEVALQMAVTTCIIIALCLLVASLYNAVGTRRLRRLYGFRDLLRGQTGTRESPPDDIPPKYDDVVEDLPTYQEALKMTMGTQRTVEEGIINLAFEDDFLADNPTTSATEEPKIIRRYGSSKKTRVKSSENGLHQKSNTGEAAEPDENSHTAEIQIAKDEKMDDDDTINYDEERSYDNITLNEACNQSKNYSIKGKSNEESTTDLNYEREFNSESEGLADKNSRILDTENEHRSVAGYQSDENSCTFEEGDSINDRRMDNSVKTKDRYDISGIVKLESPNHEIYLNKETVTIEVHDPPKYSETFNNKNQSRNYEISLTDIQKPENSKERVRSCESTV